MILVTVGSSSWDFPRLINEMDFIAGKIDEKVIMQIGDLDYKPQNAEYFKFMEKKEIEELYKTARVIVSHAGVGCIISAFKYNKPIIVVPRRQKYNEHFDDHQLDIARELSNEGKIEVVKDIKELEESLNSINRKFNSNERNIPLIIALRKYITDLDNNLNTE